MQKLKEGNFTDVYWQQSVTDSYNRVRGNEGRWMLKEKVEHSHGPGEVGRQAVRNAIAIGIYSERNVSGKDKDGNPCTVVMVKVNEQIDNETQARSMEEKWRGGAASSASGMADAVFDTFNQDVMALEDGCEEEEERVMKRPASRAMKEEKEEEAKGSTRGKACKRPAARIDEEEATSSAEEKVLKRPAGGMTQEAIDNLNKEALAQDENLNTCIKIACTKLENTILEASKMMHFLRQMDNGKTSW